MPSSTGCRPRFPSDQFLLYAFAGVPGDLDAAASEVLDRARASPDLTMRLDDSGALGYPRWTPAVEPPGVVRHQLVDASWTGCLDEVVRLADDQLDARCASWRLHLFAPVRDLPDQAEDGTVVVLQVAHALADGVRASELAAWLFGRGAPVPGLSAPQRGCLPWRAAAAARAHRQQVRDTRAGRLPPPTGDFPVLATNIRPSGVRTVRTLVRNRAALPGPTVTVAVLAAVSTALSQYLTEPCDLLGAEVPMTKSGVRQTRNHFHNVSVGLYPQLARQPRAERIAADLAVARRRARHRAAGSADRAFAAVPAALLRWGVNRFNPATRPDRVAGNTVVSSVYRGGADLRFGGMPVLLTAGYPALSPAMGLTHGVHGIGDTVAISVHAAESAIADINAYLRLLDAAL